MKPTRFLAILACIGAMAGATAARAGQETKGGILVQVNGQWVPIEEAMSYESGVFMGFDQLPTGDGSARNPVLDKDYAVSLGRWLDFFRTASPSQEAGMRRAGLTTRFIYVNRPLAFVPDELPKSDVDYKEYKKAAIYRRGDGDCTRCTGTPPTVYVSIPVMESIGSIGDRRLSVKENQGFILFHELINAAYPSLGADPIAGLGRVVIDAYVGKWTSARYAQTVARNGGHFLTDPNVTLIEKLDLIESLHEMGVLSQIRIGGEQCTEVEYRLLSTVRASIKMGLQGAIGNERDLHKLIAGWTLIESRSWLVFSLEPTAPSDFYTREQFVGVLASHVTNLARFAADACDWGPRADMRAGCQRAYDLDFSHWVEPALQEQLAKAAGPLLAPLKFAYEPYYLPTFEMSPALGHEKARWLQLPDADEKKGSSRTSYLMFVGASSDRYAGLSPNSVVEVTATLDKKREVQLACSQVNPQDLARTKSVDCSQIAWAVGYEVTDAPFHYRKDFLMLVRDGGSK